MIDLSSQEEPASRNRIARFFVTPPAQRKRGAVQRIETAVAALEDQLEALLLLGPRETIWEMHKVVIRLHSLSRVRDSRAEGLLALVDTWLRDEEDDELRFCLGVSIDDVFSSGDYATGCVGAMLLWHLRGDEHAFKWHAQRCLVEITKWVQWFKRSSDEGRRSDPDKRCG